MEPLETLFLNHSAEQYGGFDADAPDPNPDASADYAELIRDILLRRSKLYQPEIALTVCVSFPGIYLSEKKLFSLSTLHISIRREVMEELGKEGVDAVLRQQLAVACLCGRGAPGRHGSAGGEPD